MYSLYDGCKVIGNKEFYKSKFKQTVHDSNIEKLKVQRQL